MKKPLAVRVAAAIIVPIITAYVVTWLWVATGATVVVAGTAVVMIVIPAVGIAVLLVFVYKVFLRPYLRMVRIRHARERRLTEEAVRRER